jgi:hypothetical protein
MCVSVDALKLVGDTNRDIVVLTLHVHMLIAEKQVMEGGVSWFTISRESI